MNPSECHHLMVMRVRSGILKMCTAMAPLEQRECAPTPSGANPSLVAPNRQALSLMTEMMFEALTERSP